MGGGGGILAIGYCFLEIFKALMEGDKVVLGDPQSLPPLGKTLTTVNNYLKMSS